MSRLTTYAIAAACGLAYVWILSALYGYAATSHPLNDWLIDVLARRGHDTSYLVAITAHDLIVNVVLAIPFVLSVAWLRPRGIWQHLSVMWLAAVVLVNWPLIIDPGRLESAFRYGTQGLVLSIVPLPLTFLLVVFATRIGQAARHVNSA